MDNYEVNMDNSMNKALDKIKHDSRCKPTCCYGPTGPTGATGPTGPIATIDSILIAYDRTQTVTTNSKLNLGVIINSTGTEFTFTAPNKLTINTDGTYLLNFSSIINSAGIAGDLGVSMMINGVVIPTAAEYIPYQAGFFSSELQHNYNASAGDIITFINASSGSNNYHDITLSVLRLA